MCIFFIGILPDSLDPASKLSFSLITELHLLVPLILTTLGRGHFHASVWAVSDAAGVVSPFFSFIF